MGLRRVPTASCIELAQNNREVVTIEDVDWISLVDLNMKRSPSLGPRASTTEEGNRMAKLLPRLETRMADPLDRRL